MEKEEKGKVGRPLKHTRESFDKLTEAYFDSIPTDDESKILPTKSGLLHALDISRETYREYKEREEFVDTIKRAEYRIEEAWVQRLPHANATGPIFYLKNAFKEEYRDSKDLTTDGKEFPTPLLANIRDDES